MAYRIATNPEGNDMPRYTEFVTARSADIFANKDWRDEQNIAAGITLSVKEMFGRALEQAENEYDALPADREIKPENWEVLAQSLAEVICIPGKTPDIHWRIVNGIRSGKCPADYVQLAVTLLDRCIARTFNGTERARAQAVRESFINYDLIKG